MKKLLFSLALTFTAAFFIFQLTGCNSITKTEKVNVLDKVAKVSLVQNPELAASILAKGVYTGYLLIQKDGKHEKEIKAIQDLYFELLKAEQADEKDVVAGDVEHIHRLPDRQQLAWRADDDRAGDVLLSDRADDFPHSCRDVFRPRRPENGRRVVGRRDLGLAPGEVLEVQDIGPLVRPIRDKMGHERGDEAAARRVQPGVGAFCAQPVHISCAGKNSRRAHDFLQQQAVAYGACHAPESYKTDLHIPYIHRSHHPFRQYRYSITKDTSFIS